MQVLPIVFQEKKESYENFFITLMEIYLKTTTLRFAICDIDVEFDGNTYISFPVQIDAIKETVDSKRDSTTITLSDVTDDFKNYVLSGYDFRSSIVNIFEIHYPESLSDNTALNIMFYGEIDAPSMDDAKSTFKASVKDRMPNYTTGRTLMLSCNADFADPDECGATKVTHSGVVQSGSTQTHINIDISKPNGFWRYGILTIGGQSIKIKDSVGTQIITEYPFYVMPTGAYTVEQGCSKTFTWCKNQFNNGMNYSGAPSIPFELKVIS
jgi:uncharacterized phage protein (TIGR02218 family)